MYLLIWLVGLGAAVGLFYLGRRRSSRGLILGGVALAACTVVFFWFLDFWAELLWFEAVGYLRRYEVEMVARAAALLGGALLGLALAGGFARLLTPERRIARSLLQTLGLVIGAGWGAQVWEEALLWWYGVTAGLADPLLGRDVGFYLFRLPFWDQLYHLALFLALGFLAWAGYCLFFRLEGDRLNFVPPTLEPAEQAARERALWAAAAFLDLVLAGGLLLARYRLLYVEGGVVNGPGWVDVHVLLPGYLVAAGAALVSAACLALPWLRRLMLRLVRGSGALASLKGLAATSGAVAVVWLLALWVAPQMFQWLVVSPNELTLERPFIAHNIEFTRRAFGLDRVEEREFAYDNHLDQALLDQNQDLLRNIRLWDWRALDAVLKQFQEIRLYYEFQDVDVDRYHFGGGYHQVMVSPREIQQNNLPPDSRTFVNRRFKYTHGFGLALTTVSDFTAEGLPKLQLKDIPPVSSYPALAVQEPRLYYGELTDQYVIVHSSQPELDYPLGKDNAYIRYPGHGGVEITGWWRKFLFGWNFDGTTLFFSSYADPGSRIQFHRQIVERVAHLAPFLKLDRDPYIVLAGGRLYWIVDAYTTGDTYPYAEHQRPYQATGLEDKTPEHGAAGQSLASQRIRINYLRNSVKAVVDAYEGSVSFYVFDPEDPVLRTWRNVFPGLFKAADQMAPELREHVRYPVDLLLMQGQVYAKYHMTDPEVFYNQEDLWVRATEKYYEHEQPVAPYYLMWRAPGTNDVEFVLMQPFTPKNRQVLIGWIAGMCDGKNYGRFLTYLFPKGQRILGPQQVETKIDQDSFLSGQLTLWNQQGSHVIRGNVLAIPLGNTLIYVEPIYLRAETAAYPELRLVVLMHGDRLTYAPSFGEALAGLLAGAPPPAKVAGSSERTPAGGAGAGAGEALRQAREAFQRYLDALGKQKFAEAGQALEDLARALEGSGVESQQP
ncbi:MAG: UPF0182 family protein [Deltaproteobacteria bacterium]|nr:UPF0182 family protein [Deltaproteobacteria bacterium]